jgi:hypothetical protein
MVDSESRWEFSTSHCQNSYKQVKWRNFGEFPSNLAVVTLNELLVNCEKWNILLSNQIVWAPVARSSFQGRIRGIPVRFSGGTTFGQCACLYARVRLVVYLWWIGNRCESKKRRSILLSHDLCSDLIFTVISNNYMFLY